MSVERGAPSAQVLAMRAQMAVLPAADRVRVRQTVNALAQRVRRHLHPTAASPRESAVAWRRRLIRRVCLHLDGGRIAS